MLAGNHDHGLVAGWIDARLQSEPSGFLGLSEPVEPAEAGPLARAARRARRGRRGCGSPIPASGCATTSTRSTATTSTCTRPCRRSSGWPPGAMARWVVRLPEEGARPDDYEAALAPIYAFLHQLTQRSDHAAISAGRGRVGARLGRAGGRGPRAASGPRGGARHGLRRGGGGAQRARARPGRSRPVRRRRCAAAACAGSARCCAGSASPRRTCCSATRTAPGRGRATIRASGRRPPARASSTPGSWVYQPHFLSAEPNASPYWPGTAVLVEDDGAAAAHPPAGRAGPPGAANPRREARGVAGHARADPQVEHARGVVRVLDERDAAGLAHGERAAVDA